MKDYHNDILQFVGQHAKIDHRRILDLVGVLEENRNGEFFEEEIDLEKEYKAAIQACEETYGSVVIEEHSENIKSLLQQITGDILSGRMSDRLNTFFESI